MSLLNGTQIMRKTHSLTRAIYVISVVVAVWSLAAWLGLLPMAGLTPVRGLALSSALWFSGMVLDVLGVAKAAWDATQIEVRTKAPLPAPRTTAPAGGHGSGAANARRSLATPVAPAQPYAGAAAAPAVTRPAVPAVPVLPPTPPAPKRPPITVTFNDLPRLPALLGQLVHEALEETPERDPRTIARADVPDAYHVRNDGECFDVRTMRSVTRRKRV